MASIAKRADGKWRARFRDAARKEHSKHFDRKVDAQRWLDEVTTSKLTGTYVDPRAGRATVGELADAYLAGNPSWAESTRARNESIVERHIRPRWGAVPVSAVTFEDVQVWVSSMSGAGATVRKNAGVLASILDFAVKSKRLSTNPARGVDLPKQALARRQYLTGYQIEALAAASMSQFGEASPVVQWRDVTLTLAYTGLRFGELAALRKRHVDMLRRRFRIEESVTEVDGRQVWGTPKDHHRRSVPFPKFLVEPLAARLNGLDPDGLVFPGERGGVLRVRVMRRSWFDAAAIAAGVPGLTPHELRHTAASLAVSAGASVLSLQRMLGHDKPSTTLDVYADLFDEDLDAVADRLEDVRARALANCSPTPITKSVATVHEIGH
jgi:integrase